MMHEMQNEANRMMWYRRCIRAEVIIRNLEKLDLNVQTIQDLEHLREQCRKYLVYAKQLEQEYITKYPDNS